MKERINLMAVKDPKEVFVIMLSDVRRAAERSNKFYQELGDIAQDEEIKAILQARELVSSSILTRLDECFKLIGAQPAKLEGKIHDVFVEDFRREFATIESPVARRLFVLAKLSHLLHLRVGEYVALTAAADVTGNHAVGLLLETCLADKLALVERVRRVIRERAREKVAERAAAR
jgi:ferritin-like metal-binding protein YciE